MAGLCRPPGERSASRGGTIHPAQSDELALRSNYRRPEELHQALDHSLQRQVEAGLGNPGICLPGKQQGSAALGDQGTEVTRNSAFERGARTSTLSQQELRLFQAGTALPLLLAWVLGGKIPC